MKRKPIFGVFLAMLFLMTAFAEEQLEKSRPITESQAKELAQEVLDGRLVRVRVYNNWQADPRAYRIVIVPLAGLSLSHDTIRKAFPGINEWTIIVILGQDQVDEAVAAVVDDFVYVDTYGRQKSLSIWPPWSRVPDYTYWAFTDALGDPIPKASVEILLCSYLGESQEIYLSKVVLDTKGRLKPLILCDSFFRFVFVISHPKYGKAAVEKCLGDEQGDGYVMRYVVPLVPKASQAASRAIQGHVVNFEGNGLGAMPVTCDDIRTANDNPLNIYKGFYGRSVTDEQGWFTMYMPLEESGQLSRNLIPAGAQYDLSVVPPKSLNMHSHYERGVPAGGYRLITLASIRPDKHFHTFAFEDERGLITGPEELQRISVTLTRGVDQRQWLKLEYAQWKGGFSLQEGTLRAETRRWDQPFHFEPIELTSESPKELVFKAGQEIIYQGAVVEGSTGEPMANVLVLVEHPYRAEGSAGLTDEQLVALRARALRQEIEGLSTRTLYEYDDRVTLTDPNGRYQFVFRTGLQANLDRFTALEKGYVAEETAFGPICRPNRAGVVAVSPLRLIPERKYYWPVFVFEDRSGAVIADPNMLEQIFFTIERGQGSGRGQWSRSYKSLMEGNEFIRGTYYATLDWQGQRYLYGPVEVTWGGPVEVVFKVREVRPIDLIYQGRVVNGITGAPMPGAFVMSQFWAMDKLDASAILPEQWEAIRQSGPQPDPNDAALIPLREAFQFDKITRADATGQFQLRLGPQGPAAGPRRLVAVQEDFLGAQQELRYLVPRDKSDSERARLAEFQPDADGYIKLPAMKLYPAATVAVEPNLPYVESTKHRVRFYFHTLPDDPTPWLRDFWGDPLGAKGASVLFKYDLRPNELQTVHVLAGPEIILKIVPMLSRKAPVTIRNIKLKQGQFLDLGRQDFLSAFEVAVKVIDSAGEPVEGAAVNCRDTDGFSWGPSSLGRMPITDENGKTALYVPPYSRGEFVVTAYNPASGTSLREGTPYEVAGEEEDAGKQFTLQLSDEMLSLLRK